MNSFLFTKLETQYCQSAQVRKRSTRFKPAVPRGVSCSREGSLSRLDLAGMVLRKGLHSLWPIRHSLPSVSPRAEQEVSISHRYGPGSSLPRHQLLLQRSLLPATSVFSANEGSRNVDSKNQLDICNLGLDIPVFYLSLGRKLMGLFLYC